MPTRDKVEYARKTLKEFVPVINKELEKFWKVELARIPSYSTQFSQISKHFVEHIREHNLRPAKRLRGAFVYYGYQLLNGHEQCKEILRASISIELVHTALLIHDDFMDQDDIRRGQPTTHVYYRDYHQQRKLLGSSEKFGNNMAVDFGDLALTWGYRILTELKCIPTEKAFAALKMLLNGIIFTGYGQAYDVYLETLPYIREQDIFDLHTLKTSIYTYRTPLFMGATLGGAGKSDLKLIEKYAIPGGIAFQLQDDILGLFGDSEKTGKPDFSDLKEGKKTLLIDYALKKANAKQKKILLAAWGNGAVTKEEAEAARQVVRETGSLAYSYETAAKYAKISQTALPAMRKKGWNPEVIYFLDGIAEYMATKRES